MENQSSRYKLTISYDGSNFSGSQRQKNGRSVQEELERVCSQLAGKPVACEFSGRTDRGVHAVGQVVVVEQVRPEMPLDRLQIALNNQLPKDIAVNEVALVPQSMHPRYDAAWREYRYRFWVGTRQPLLERTAWRISGEFNLDLAMQAAAQFRGERDFATFAGMGHGVPWSERRTRRRSTIRTVMRCSVRAVPHWWGTAANTGSGYEFRVVADGFLPNMVRTMSSAVVQVASGKREPGWVSELLALSDRRLGPATAPAQGLIFWKVGYGDESPEPDPH